MTNKELSVVYYTSNFLDTENPFFLANTQKYLVKAIGDLPLIVVSQKPMPSFPGYTGEYTNICIGDVGRSHLNLYTQIMIGAKAAKTKYVAMAEDDILYSYNHFHSPEIDNWFKNDRQLFLYDMNKVSIFTWNKTPMFSFRTNRKVVNQLIAPAKMLAEAMEERFRRKDYLLGQGMPLERILHVWGDPGRYEDKLGVTVRESAEFYCDDPSIVFSHPKAFGYLNHGKRKRLGDIRIIELYSWGRADKLLDEVWGTTARE